PDRAREFFASAPRQVKFTASAAKKTLLTAGRSGGNKKTLLTAGPSRGNYMRFGVMAVAVAGAMFAAASHAESFGPPVADVKRGTIGAGLDYSTLEFKMKRDEGFNPAFD